MRLTALILCAGGLCAATGAHAGPWTRSLGEAYVKVGETAFGADEFVDSTGTAVDAEYLGLTTSLYAEVGVAEGLQVVLYLPHVVGRNTNDVGDRFLSTGGGDLSLGLQWSTPWLDFPHAVRVATKLPLYDVTEPRGFQGALFPDRGDGQVDVDAWVSVGGSLSVAPLYGFVEIGHRFRTETYLATDTGVAYADSGLLAAQLGWTVFAGVVLAANVSGVMPYGDDATTKGYLNAGPSVFAPVGAGIAIEAAYDRTLTATNSSIGQSVSLGVSYSL